MSGVGTVREIGPRALLAGAGVLVLAAVGGWAIGQPDASQPVASPAVTVTATATTTEQGWTVPGPETTVTATLATTRTRRVTRTDRVVVARTATVTAIPAPVTVRPPASTVRLPAVTQRVTATRVVAGPRRTVYITRTAHSIRVIRRTVTRTVRIWAD